MTWKIFDPANDPRGVGFRGVVRGKSDNQVLPNQCVDMYNYISDGGPKKRKGNTIDNGTELVTDTGITGIFQFYNGSAYKTFAKCGTRVFDASTAGNSPYLLTAVTEAGDTSDQLSSWSLTGGGNVNTNAGVLYYSLTWSGTTATIDIYKNSDGAAENKVATGTGSQSTTITLNAANTSGLSGTVAVAAKVGDDTDLANNTLTYPTLTAADELQFMSWFSRYFFSDGTNIYSGTTGAASAISLLDESGVAISGVKPHGKTIFLRGERMWITRDPSYPTRVYFSRQDYYDRFGTNGGADILSWVACDRDDGQAITGAIRHEDRIFVTKRQKSYWIYGDPSDTYPYSGTLTVIDGPATGAYDQKTIVSCPDGYIRWWGPDGVYQCSLGSKEIHISDAIDYELNQIADADKTKACAGFVDHYYLLMLPNGILDYCDGFALDTRTGEWYPIRNWNISCMYRFADDTLHAGFYNEGYICQLFDGTVDNSGAEDISCYLQTKLKVPPGFEYKKYEHCLDKLQMFNIKNGQSFNLFWNANEGRASGSWSFTFDAAGEYLGEFELGDEGDPDVGDIMISEDELTNITANPSKRMNSAQRFSDIYFEVSETGPTEHSFDRLEISSYPIGEVR
jgi:hypothetical protein